MMEEFLPEIGFVEILIETISRSWGLQHVVLLAPAARASPLLR